MASLQEEFIAWQCRVRKEAVRMYGGRPRAGMRPGVARTNGALMSEITVLLAEEDPTAHTGFFRHIVRQTPDPKKRYESALKLLAAEYYARPERFSGMLTAQFARHSAIMPPLIDAGHCILAFAQGARAYGLPCAVEELASSDANHQATYWHNHLFNPCPPDEIRVLEFRPIWEESWREDR
jgi:hypothetical protein